MANCSGNCAGCSGCAKELVLSREELDMLRELGQIPFLPVARMPWEEEPVFPERNTPEITLVLRCLEKKGLISLDYDMPLKGYDYGVYRVQGSMALTERGHQVLELLEWQGVQPE